MLRIESAETCKSLKSYYRAINNKINNLTIRRVIYKETSSTRKPIVSLNNSVNPTHKRSTSDHLSPVRCIPHDFPKNQINIEKRRPISDQISPRRCIVREPLRSQITSVHKRTNSNQFSPRRSILHEVLQQTDNSIDQTNSTSKLLKEEKVEPKRETHENFLEKVEKTENSKLPPTLPLLNIRNSRFRFKNQQTVSEQVSPVSKQENEHNVERSNVRRPSIPFDMGKIMKLRRPKEDQIFPMRFVINETPKEQSFCEIDQLNNICKKLIEEQKELKKQIHDQKNQIDQLKNEKDMQAIENSNPPPASNDNFIQTHQIQLKDPHILSAEIELQPKNEEVSSGFKLDEALFTFMDFDSKNMAETSRFGAVPEPPKFSRFPKEVFVRRVKRSRG